MPDGDEFDGLSLGCVSIVEIYLYVSREPTVRVIIEVTLYSDWLSVNIAEIMFDDQFTVTAFNFRHVIHIQETILSCNQKPRVINKNEKNQCQ